MFDLFELIDLQTEKPKNIGYNFAIFKDISGTFDLDIQSFVKYA
jgi:hypothetical protein